MFEVKMQFETKEQAELFFQWMCDAGGEQDYWEFCECGSDFRERLKNMVAFDYHNGSEFLQNQIVKCKTAMHDKLFLRIADATTRPGSRYKSGGAYSGEWYREDFLLPMLEKAINAGMVLVVNLDGVEGYATSFLEELFGGAARKLGKPAILNTIIIQCSDEPGLVDEVLGYIRNA